jgi:hypothetical protein
MRTSYGNAMARSIEWWLWSIRIANLVGNTTDWVLFLLSFGRLGVPRKHPMEEG